MQKEMQSTIDKLISDKKQLSEMLKDREAEMNRINDPRNLRDLKYLLFELESNMTQVDLEKQREWEQIKVLLLLEGLRKLKLRVQDEIKVSIENPDQDDNLLLIAAQKEVENLNDKETQTDWEAIERMQNDNKTSPTKKGVPLNNLFDQAQKKNPILRAVQEVLNRSSPQKLGYDPTAKFPEQMIFKIMEISMEEKVKYDLDIENMDYEQRKSKTQSFSHFLYDSILMQYGLKTIAIKNIVQMTNGIKAQQGQNYAKYLGRIIGLFPPQMYKDEINLFLKCHLFFKEVQGLWVKRAQEKGQFKLSDEQLNNVSTGGECLVFDLIDELVKAFKDDREMSERILSNIKPDCILKQENPQLKKKLSLEYSLLKITTRIAKLGKDAKFIYDTLDKDKSGSLERNELLMGLKNNFSVYFSESETEAVMIYLDSDGSGDIDFSEFNKKVNFKELQQISRVNQYTISKVTFIDMMMKEWEYHKSREANILKELFKKYDDNGDNVLVLGEFETLIKAIEPNLKKKQVVSIFQQTLENQSSLDDAVDPEIFVLMVQNNKLGGYGKEFFTDYLKTTRATVNKRASLIKKE